MRLADDSDRESLLRSTHDGKDALHDKCPLPSCLPRTVVTRRDSEKVLSPSISGVGLNGQVKEGVKLLIVNISGRANQLRGPPTGKGGKPSLTREVGMMRRGPRRVLEGRACSFSSS